MIQRLFASAAGLALLLAPTPAASQVPPPVPLVPEALGSEAVRTRVAEQLDGLDPAATEALFRSAHPARTDSWSASPEAMAGLWKQLTREAAWQAAARVIVEHYFPILRLDRDGFAPFVHAAEAQWVHHPSRRGTLLYLLARGYQLQNGEALDDRGNTKTFREHMTSFGAPFDRALFDAALDASPLGLRVAPLVAQAVDGEVPVVDDSLARLDAYLDAEAALAGGRQTRRRTLDEAAARTTLDALSALACDRGRVQELAQLRATLAARLASHEEEDVAFGYLVPESTPRLCRTSEGAKRSDAPNLARRR
jgi:hypothetical protein